MSSRECANWLVRTLAVLIMITAGSHNCAVMAQEAGIRDITIWKPLRKLTDPIQKKYNELPGQGKMATGAFVGFTASRVAVKSITSCIKFAGAAFVAVEVLDYAGLLKDLDDFELYEENKATIKAVKQSFVKSVKEFKTGIRNQLNPKTLDARIKANKEASTGFAAGAFVGFMI